MLSIDTHLCFTFFEHSFDGALLIDSQGDCLEVNTSACEILGIERDELLKKNVTDIFAHSNRVLMEFDYVNPKGQKKTIFCKVVEHTKDQSHLWILKDVTTERELARQELHSVLMQAPLPICILSGPELTYTFANPLYERIVGRKVLSLPIKQAFDKTEIEKYLPIFDSVLESGESYSVRESPYLLKDRSGVESERYLNIDYHAYKDLSEKPVGVMIIIHDVTKLVRARQKIQESEYRYRTLSECLPQLTWSADPSGHVNFANNRCLSYTGLGSEEKFGEGWITAIHPDDLLSVGPDWFQSMRTGEPFNREYRIRGTNGVYRWFLGRAIPIRNEKQEITQWIGTATDIEDQKRFIEKLEIERTLREQFVSMLSHDLRNPLAAAKFSAQMILHYGNESAKLEQLANKILEGVTRADKMILDLLDANRVKAGEKLPLNLEDCHLNAILVETVEELSSVYGERFRLVCDANIYGHWSHEALRRIIENLCTNAIKYGDQSEPVSISARKSEEFVVISVNNKGNPISAEELSQLFDPFHRTQSADSNGTKGWGLGLTLVKGLCEAHDGDVSVESSEELGTTFTVRIPRVSRQSYWQDHLEARPHS